MKNIEYIKDNMEERNDEYIDSEIIADNQDQDDLARIAHEINDCVDPTPTIADVGNIAAEFRERCYSMIETDYSYLDQDQVAAVMKIIEENYMEE